jgi:KTSC domain-containing protein
MGGPCPKVFAMLALAVSLFPYSAAKAAEPVTLVSHIRRAPLDSSALATAGYSKRRHILEIEFCNGALYRYLEVPPSIYRDFMSAESKAWYYDWNIKGQYHSLRLRKARMKGS